MRTQIIQEKAASSKAGSCSGIMFPENMQTEKHYLITLIQTLSLGHIQHMPLKCYHIGRFGASMWIPYLRPEKACHLPAAQQDLPNFKCRRLLHGSNHPKRILHRLCRRQCLEQAQLEPAPLDWPNRSVRCPNELGQQCWQRRLEYRLQSAEPHQPQPVSVCSAADYDLGSCYRKSFCHLSLQLHKQQAHQCFWR